MVVDVIRFYNDCFSRTMRDFLSNGLRVQLLELARLRPLPVWTLPTLQEVYDAEARRPSVVLPPAPGTPLMPPLSGGVGPRRRLLLRQSNVFLSPLEPSHFTPGAGGLREPVPRRPGSTIKLDSSRFFGRPDGRHDELEEPPPPLDPEVLLTLTRPSPPAAAAAAAAVRPPAEEQDGDYDEGDWSEPDPEADLEERERSLAAGQHAPSPLSSAREEANPSGLSPRSQRLYSQSFVQRALGPVTGSSSAAQPRSDEQQQQQQTATGDRLRSLGQELRRSLHP